MASGTKAGITEGGPDPLSATSSLGALIRAAHQRPVHIIFVHGMRAEGPGTSAAFRDRLCAHVGDGCQSGGAHAARVQFDLGAYPSEANILHRPIWSTEAEWLASRPFVDRYVFSRRSGAPIIVDEVNWWPLLFPLKCRFLLKPESNLSGVDKKHLQLCARSDDPFYPWLSQDEVDHLIATPPKSGGGARLNAILKREIMNWGLSDAVMAVGSMRLYYRRAMNAAFGYAAMFDGKPVDEREFVVISESLGSFAVMDAYEHVDAPHNAVRDVLDRTYLLYFFANQFALLELARVEGLPGFSVSADIADGAPAPSASPLKALEHWAQHQSHTERFSESDHSVRVSQIIAFNDPSDLLTFDVPAITGVKVVNLYDRNGFDFVGWFENPITAHTGHSANKNVLRAMFE